jgi:hypothetical protein
MNIIATKQGQLFEAYLCNSSCNHTNSNFGHKLHRYFTMRLGVLQVVNQLRKILNRIDIVVRRRGNQSHSWCGVPVACNVFRDLEAWQLTALSRLRTLRHLNLDLVTIRQVVRCYTKATRGNLLNSRTAIIQKALGVFTTFSCVGPATNLVHGLGKGFVCFLTDRSK